jgi:mannose-6-phosphate isomerase-like protein (cupin superfamily)
MDLLALGPGEGRAFNVGPDRVTVKADADRTSDALSMIEYEAAPGVPGPPPHVHRVVHEVWYILEGAVEFYSGDRTLRAGPGSFLHVPPGVPHTFANVGDGPARWIGIFSPGRFSRLLEEIAKAFPAEPGPPDEAQILRAFADYDTEIVGH